jgi:diaminopimelate epimerase
LISFLAGLAVQRMNGAGNKILVLDLRGSLERPTAAEARAIHRSPGLDFDQLMVLTEPKTANTAAFVSIFNNDGTLAGACGNGARCVADRLCREGQMETVTIETEAGVIACERLGSWLYRVDMGPPRLRWDEIPLALAVADTRFVDLGLPADDPISALGPPAGISMGNPHAIFIVPDIDRIDAALLGARIEVLPIFPEKANVTFAEINARDAVRARVWERGVGLTEACGSAACATVVAAVRRELTDRKAAVRLPGGELVIEWTPGDGHVLMTGPVEFERELVLDDAMFEAAL